MCVMRVRMPEYCMGTGRPPGPGRKGAGIRESSIINCSLKVYDYLTGLF